MIPSAVTYSKEGYSVRVRMTDLLLSLSAPFEPAGGYCWAAPLPRHLAAFTDSSEEARVSALILTENGRKLYPRHATHDDIQRAGAGRHSFWNDMLYFSSTDNSDPNTNNRSYQISLVHAAALHNYKFTDNLPHHLTYTLRRPFRESGGSGWAAVLPLEFQDENMPLDEPQWELFEDDLKLGPAHSRPAEIATLGGGRYWHLTSQLHFSASDNSDPNSNGRVYKLGWTGKGGKSWLARFEHKAPRVEHPLGPREEVVQCSGLIAIYGFSFSGSTLLNAVLGAHPDIFGAGELSTENEAFKCAICWSGCQFWTEGRRAATKTENLYHHVSRISGRPFVSDSSKSPVWFNHILPHFPTLPVARVLLVKHPVRHVASILEKKDTVGSAPDGSPFDGWEAAVFGLRQFYEQFVLPGESERETKYYHPTYPRTPIDIVLRYEDFVASPATALGPILGKLGLEYHSRMELWAHVEQHCIGGNIGPRLQINNLKVPNKPKYARRGIFLDNYYAEILDLETVEVLFRDPDSSWIIERFGYGSAPIYG